MEHNSGGLEDDFPDFTWVIFRFQHLIFKGVYEWKILSRGDTLAGSEIRLTS